MLIWGAKQIAMSRLLHGGSGDVVFSSCFGEHVKFYFLKTGFHADELSQKDCFSLDPIFKEQMPYLSIIISLILI